MPTVSVIMSVYNEPVDWITLSIESILNQTFKDFEFIIVNDNPYRQDNDIVLKGFSEMDSRIKVLCNKSNIGLPKSLNKAISISCGKYIARMDADDIAYPNRLERQIEFLKDNSNTDVLGGGAICIDSANKKIGLFNVDSDGKILSLFTLFQSQFIHPTVVFKKRINDKTVQYNESFLYAQDYALWVDLLGCSFSNIKEPVLKYRVSTGQISGKNRRKQLEYTKRIQEMAINKLGLRVSDTLPASLFNFVYSQEEYSKDNVAATISDITRLCQHIKQRYGQNISQCFNHKALYYSCSYLCTNCGIIDSLRFYKFLANKLNVSCTAELILLIKYIIKKKLER